MPHDYATTLNKDHGRIERRECWTKPILPGYLSTGQDWPGLRSVVKVVGRRETPAGTNLHSDAGASIGIHSVTSHPTIMATLRQKDARPEVGIQETPDGQARRNHRQ